MFFWKEPSLELSSTKIISNLIPLVFLKIFFVKLIRFLFSFKIGMIIDKEFIFILFNILQI